MTLVQAAKCARFLHISPLGIMGKLHLGIQYGGLQLSPFSVQYRQCTHFFKKAVCLEIDVRGVLASYCVLMDRNSFKCVRPFRRFGTKLFSGSLPFTHKTIPGDHLN